MHREQRRNTGVSRAVRDSHQSLDRMLVEETYCNVYACIVEKSKTLTFPNSCRHSFVASNDAGMRNLVQDALSQLRVSERGGRWDHIGGTHTILIVKLAADINECITTSMGEGEDYPLRFNVFRMCQREVEKAHMYTLVDNLSRMWLEKANNLWNQVCNILYGTVAVITIPVVWTSVFCSWM